MNESRLIKNPLVLNKNIEMICIKDFHEQTASRLGGDKNDHIISVPNSRISSKRISNDAIEFIRNFSRPCLLLDAVVAYAQISDLEPNDILTQVFPMVSSLINAGMIVYPESASNRENVPRYLNGESIKGFEIIKCTQFLADKEVYLAKDHTGRKAVLKYYPAAGSLKEMIAHEIDVLNKLKADNCPYIPVFLNVDIERPDPIFILEWIEGKTLFEVLNDGELKLENRITIIQKLILAYQSIHNSGILHVDVHPNNVIVNERYDVHLIDFECAIDSKIRKNTIIRERVGAVSYYEPESAKAFLGENLTSVINEATEQYTIAVLIYLIITGNMYLALSLEKETALRQIAFDQPRPFCDFQLEWQELEQILERALSKLPGNRHDSLDNFYLNITNCLNRRNIVRYNYGNPSGNILSSADTSEFDQRISKFISSYGLSSQAINKDLILGPTSSLFHGAAGIAYTFLRLSSIFKSPELLATADIWILKAKNQQHDINAFINPELGMSPFLVGSCSLFHSAAGLHVVDAMVQYARGDIGEHLKAIDRFITLCKNYPHPDHERFAIDTAQGPASLLTGISLLLPFSTVVEGFPLPEMHQLIQYYSMHLIRRLEQDLLSKKSPFVKAYLGFAHGYTGVLYSILHVNHIAGIEIQKSLEACLTALTSLSQKRSNGLAWPIHSSSEDLPWTGWCHGSAGYILLWLLASTIYKNDNYISIAKDAGEYLWLTHGKSGNSLCCGLAGESLSLFALGKATHDQKWHDRGLHLAKKAVNSKNNFEIPHSLFKGETGISLLAAEALHPGSSVWPIFQSII
ncbi:MAG: hypothetical protein JWP45_2170 [Mucilaginibacter sp.]|nr:hypothetical protein [Mucilaginibacter sp.]